MSLGDGSEIPVTPEEDEHFRADLAGLAARAAGTDEPGPSDRDRRPDTGPDHRRRAGRGGAIFQPLHWRHPDAFVTLRAYINQLPDETEVWVENGNLHFAYGDPA